MDIFPLPTFQYTSSTRFPDEPSEDIGEKALKTLLEGSAILLLCGLKTAAWGRPGLRTFAINDDSDSIYSGLHWLAHTFQISTLWHRLAGL
jgi:hypothetical protein